MPVPRSLLVVVLLGQLVAPVLSADTPSLESCLTKAEQRAAVAANQAMPLTQAIKVMREHRKYSEVVRARLCRIDGKLAYVLTLLGRSGKVVNATIDAVTGEYHTGG
jgi:uncharacterized membrane protein YkoI